MIDKNVPAISLAGVTKRYGSLSALDGVDLTVPQGQTIAILGPNGAGKTTAVSLMLGLRTPTHGKVEMFGGDPRNIRTRSAMGAMLQSSGVPEYLRVREAIKLFCTYYPRPMPFAHIVELCGLQEKVNARVAALSGGQVQRLYFALAICGDPKIVLLDEPTAALDVEGRRSMLATIHSIAQQGRTVVLTTHYLEEADALADRIVVMNRGVIVADGTPSDIKSTVGQKKVAYIEDGQPHDFLTDSPETVLRELFARNAQITGLTVTGASLEEAFLHLTKREEHHVV